MWTVGQSFVEGDAHTGSLDDWFFSLDPAHTRALTIECGDRQPSEPLFGQGKEEAQARLLGALRYVGNLAAEETAAGTR